MELFYTRYHTKHRLRYNPRVRIAHQEVPIDLISWMSVDTRSKCGELFEAFQTQMSGACKKNTWHWKCRSKGDREARSMAARDLIRTDDRLEHTAVA